MKNLIHLSFIFSHVCKLVLLGFIINVFLCICLGCASKYAYYSVAIIIIAHIHTHCCFECYINIGQTVSLIFWHTVFFLSGEKENTQYSLINEQRQRHSKQMISKIDWLTCHSCSNNSNSSMNSNKSSNTCRSKLHLNKRKKYKENIKRY